LAGPETVAVSDAGEEGVLDGSISEVDDDEVGGEEVALFFLRGDDFFGFAASGHEHGTSPQNMHESITLAMIGLGPHELTVLTVRDEMLAVVRFVTTKEFG